MHFLLEKLHLMLSKYLLNVGCCEWKLQNHQMETFFLFFSVDSYAFYEFTILYFQISSFIPFSIEFTYNIENYLVIFYIFIIKETVKEANFLIKTDIS